VGQWRRQFPNYIAQQSAKLVLLRDELRARMMPQKADPSLSLGMTILR
jgi:hypothetical protein